MRCCGRFPYVMLSAALAAVLVVGCSKEKDNGKQEVKKDTTGKSGDNVTPAGGAAEVVGTGTGTLKGKVTLVGAMPEIKSEKDRMEMQGDKNHCLKGDTNEQTWKIDPNTKAVQYVVVWLRPVQKGSYFKLSDAEKSNNTVVKMDQPFCQFEPHVVAFYPSYFNGKKQVPTGEKFEIHNSAPINHNTAWKGGNSANTGKNEIIKSKQMMVVDAQPSATEKKPGEDLIRINCDIHKWMNAFAWVFDHPFFAVTDKEGNYEIKNVPAGVEVEIVHWHETFDKPKAEKATLKAGENVKNFEIKK